MPEQRTYADLLRIVGRLLDSHGASQVEIVDHDTALAVSWLVGFLHRQGVAPFGWYRLVIALLFAVLLWSNLLAVPVLQ